MVTLPPQFIATKYPGYFWNVEDRQLYSIKVSGTLKPLVRCYPSYWTDYKEGYKVSVTGHRRFMSMDYLRALNPTDSVIPIGRPKAEPTLQVSTQPTKQVEHERRI